MNKKQNLQKSNDAIFNAMSITPTFENIEFVYAVINGGKTDDSERAFTISSYFDREDCRKAIYDILYARFHFV